MLVTRQLLTHSSGMAYTFMDPLLTRYEELQGKPLPGPPTSVVSRLTPLANTISLPPSAIGRKVPPPLSRV